MKTLISLLLVFCFASTSMAVDVELIGETKVEALRFNDLSVQTTAMTAGVQGIQGIQGVQGDTGATGADGSPGLPGPTAPERILYINRLSIADFVPVWLNQGNSWLPFVPAFSVIFSKISDTSLLRLGWSDNVGIYGASWCNIGLFLDSEAVTNCTGSWSGVTGTTIFNQQNISCVLAAIPAGTHSIQVKHRSQYCVFGNYAFDSSGSNRFISVEEQN